MWSPSRTRRRDDAGVSSVELVLYMPLLMMVILLAIQFSLVWFGNQAASATAREAARVARVYGDKARAVEAGNDYVERIADGALEGAVVRVEIGEDTVRVTVTGRAQEILPWGVPTVSQTVVGPREQFEGDAP